MPSLFACLMESQKHNLVNTVLGENLECTVTTMAETQQGPGQVETIFLPCLPYRLEKTGLGGRHGSTEEVFSLPHPHHLTPLFLFSLFRRSWRRILGTF